MTRTLHFSYRQNRQTIINFIVDAIKDLGLTPGNYISNSSNFDCSIITEPGRQMWINTRVVQRNGEKVAQFSVSGQSGHKTIVSNEMDDLQAAIIETI